MYRSLNADHIITTAKLLHQRINERFPHSGLTGVSAELAAECQQAAATARWLATPQIGIRFISAIAIIAMLAVAASTFFIIEQQVEVFSNVSDFLQGLDAGINELVVIGAATYFLLGWETRLKRRRALRAIHVLRSLAHIIDMHQLTKDPERIRTQQPDTPSSPARNLNPFELTRYLDYCSEMLSIISKIAALYVQDFDDTTTLAAVDEVEDLTGSLSQKMWQKIMILDRMVPDDATRSADAAC